MDGEKVGGVDDRFVSDDGLMIGMVRFYWTGWVDSLPGHTLFLPLVRLLSNANTCIAFEIPRRCDP